MSGKKKLSRTTNKEIDQSIFSSFDFLMGFFTFVVFVLFFTVICPFTLYDQDDWALLYYTRGLLPDSALWNPIKVLPETIMPFAAYFGMAFIYPVANDFYSAVTIGFGIVYSVLVSIYFVCLDKVISKYIKLDICAKVIVEILFITMHFLPYLIGMNNNAYLLNSGNSCVTFNYSCSVVVNGIAVCLLLLYQEIIESFFKNGHWIKKMLIVLTIYFAIFSNLFNNIVIATCAAFLLLNCVIRNLKLKNSISIIISQGFIYMMIPLLWIISLYCEYSGGRSKQVGQSTLDIAGSIKELANVIMKWSIIFRYFMLITIVFSAVIIVMYNIKKQLIEKMLGEYAEQVVRVMTGCLFCSVMCIIFIVLLAAKISPGYLNSPGVQFSFLFYLICLFVLSCTVLCIRTTKTRYAFYTLSTIAFIVVLLFGKTYRIVGPYDVKKCRDITNMIINQVKEADQEGADYVEIRVPKYSSDDNCPLALYMNTRVSYTLYVHKVVKRYIPSEIVPDEELTKYYSLE